MFLHLTSVEFDNHIIYSEWRLLLDHALLIVNIMNFKKHIQTKKQTIIKNSEEKRNFITNLTESIKKLNIDHIVSKKDLE